MKNQVLPTYKLPEPVKSFAENLLFFQSIGELEGMLTEGKQQQAWPAEFVAVAGKALNIQGGRLVDVRRPIPKYVVQGILDNVKNRLLDFVLKMQDEISDDTVEAVDLSNARNIFNTYVYGNQNAVNVAEQLSIKDAIRRGDVRSLENYFRSEGISDGDLKSLKAAISSQPQPKKGKFSVEVYAWVGDMVSKAVAGSWKMAIERAPTVLVDGLLKYFGG